MALKLFDPRFLNWLNQGKNPAHWTKNMFIKRKEQHSFWFLACEKTAGSSEHYCVQWTVHSCQSNCGLQSETNRFWTLPMITNVYKMVTCSVSIWSYLDAWQNILLTKHPSWQNVCWPKWLYCLLAFLYILRKDDRRDHRCGICTHREE